MRFKIGDRIRVERNSLLGNITSPSYHGTFTFYCVQLDCNSKETVQYEHALISVHEKRSPFKPNYQLLEEWL